MRHLVMLTRALLAALLLTHAQGAFAQTRTITVTGEASAHVSPDMAVLSLGVTTFAQTAAAAMADNSAALQAVSARLAAAGIEPRDLQTSGLSLGPNVTSYDSAGVPVVSGYTATIMLTVRVRDLEKLGALVDAAIRDGANTLNGLTFDVAEPGPAQDRARAQAVEEALRRAGLLASAAGVRLGKVLSISEGGGFSGPQPMFREAAMDSAVPITAGQIALTAAVTVVIALED